MSNLIGIAPARHQNFGFLGNLLQTHQVFSTRFHRESAEEIIYYI